MHIHVCVHAIRLIITSHTLSHTVCQLHSEISELKDKCNELEDKKSKVEDENLKLEEELRKSINKISQLESTLKTTEVTLYKNAEELTRMNIQDDSLKKIISGLKCKNTALKDEAVKLNGGKIQVEINYVSLSMHVLL